MRSTGHGYPRAPPMQRFLRVSRGALHILHSGWLIPCTQTTSRIPIRYAIASSRRPSRWRASWRGLPKACLQGLGSPSPSLQHGLALWERRCSLLKCQNETKLPVTHILTATYPQGMVQLDVEPTHDGAGAKTNQTHATHENMHDHPLLIERTLLLQPEPGPRFLPGHQSLYARGGGGC